MSVVAFEAVALPTTVAYLVPEVEEAKLWTISGGDVYGVWAAIGMLAALLSLGMAVLFLPGMPSELIWPEEWAIVGLWRLLGLVLILRVPQVGPGRDAEDRLMARTGA